MLNKNITVNDFGEETSESIKKRRQEFKARILKEQEEANTNKASQQLELWQIINLKREKHKVNLLQKQEEIREAKYTKVYSIVNFLLKDNQLVEMARNFIDELPINFYTDDLFLQHIDYIAGEACSPYTFLLSPKQKELFVNENVEYINKTRDEIRSYFIEKIGMFIQVLIDHTKIVLDIHFKEEVFITYVFIYNVVIEHLAKKWQNEYQQYFQDIAKLNLDEAIERYCTIDTVVPLDKVSLGKFVYYLINNEKFDNGDRNYFNCLETVLQKINSILEYKKYNNFVNRITTLSTTKLIKYTINDVDLMNGVEFEELLAELFFKMGYESETTKATGDQGIDVIASKNGNRIGIQAKCYSSSVGNSAIQEAVAGKNHYRLDKAIVVTNNFFTDSAKQLAQSNSIILWDRHILKEKIDEHFNASM
ncbi:MAG: hypothetical protein CTY13_02610 [Methylobacter sp.]|nr:MAG: hypothetical protein CTY13_02610 [Methylobacter sp.]